MSSERGSNNFFRTEDANRALDEYDEAFGSANDFYMHRAIDRPAEEEANFAHIIRKAIRKKTPMTDAKILEMYGISRHNFFNTADANRALDEYETAFGRAKVFYFLHDNRFPPEKETEFARVIRKAVRTGTPMSEDKILDMYGFFNGSGVIY